MTRRTRKRTSDKVGGVRPGRPGASPETARRNRVVTLVTDAEYSKLVQIVESTGRSMSAVCRQILARSLTEQPETHIDQGEDT